MNLNYITKFNNFSVLFIKSQFAEQYFSYDFFYYVNDSNYDENAIITLNQCTVRSYT